MKKLIYTAILSALVLQSCSKDEVLSLGANENSIATANDASVQTLSFAVGVDATYEYDDEFRAIQVTADDAPRIKLSEAELNGLDPDKFKPAGRGDRLEFNALRINWFSYGTDNTLKSREHLNINEPAKNIERTIKVENVNGKDVVKVWLKLNWDVPTLRKQAGGTWFAQMIVGGFPGKTDKGKQFFSRYRQGAGLDQEDVRSHPNSRIDELLPGTGEMGRRHFPLIGDITLINNNYWSKPGVPGNYENNTSSSTGQMGINEEMLLKVRGTIFTFTLENKTGLPIEVTDIEVPVKNGSTRGAAFSFEGYFNSMNLRPFGASGVLDPAGCVPVFEKYSSRFAPANEETNLFPLYRQGGTRNVPLAVDQVSAGRFMVWAYVHDASKPFALRVRYTSGGNTYYSNFQTVTPPATGFKEGKAYRSKLLIKGGTQI